MKKFTLLLLSLLGLNTAMAQSSKLYFSIGDTPVTDQQQITLYAPVELSDNVYGYYLTCKDVIMHCEDNVDGKVSIVVKSLGEEHIAFGGYGDEDYPLCWTPDWEVQKERRVLRGHKEALEILVPVDYNYDPNEIYTSGLIELKIGRPECDGECFPAVYEYVQTFYLKLTNDPQVKAGIESVDAGKAAVNFSGRTLSYALDGNRTNISIHSLDGALMYSGTADSCGSLDLGFLPAGVYTYKVGRTTGKMLVK